MLTDQKLPGYRFPLSVIGHAVWLYHRYALSYRDVEELLFKRGVEVSRESIRTLYRSRCRPARWSAPTSGRASDPVPQAEFRFHREADPGGAVADDCLSRSFWRFTLQTVLLNDVLHFADLPLLPTAGGEISSQLHGNASGGYFSDAGDSTTWPPPPEPDSPMADANGTARASFMPITMFLAISEPVRCVSLCDLTYVHEVSSEEPGRSKRTMFKGASLHRALTPP